MGYLIFEVNRSDIGKIDQVLKDDTVSRQSITTRDASSLEIEKDALYVKIEGSKDGLKRAEELFKEIGIKKLRDKDATEINKKIVSQDESAATGMGMIFG